MAMAALEVVKEENLCENAMKLGQLGGPAAAASMGWVRGLACGSPSGPRPGPMIADLLTDLVAFGYQSVSLGLLSTNRSLVVANYALVQTIMQKLRGQCFCPTSVPPT